MPAAADAAAQAAAAVQIRDSAFAPQVLTVPQGATVTWARTGGLPHTVTAAAAFDSGILIGGGTFSRTFGAVETFGYHGAAGSGMFATVVVVPAQPEATAAPAQPTGAPATVAPAPAAPAATPTPGSAGYSAGY
jgi:plastocyanin